MKKSLALILTLSLLTLVAAGCGSGSGSDDVIKIGFLGALTGEVASYGIYTLKGMELAVEEINEAGGVLGKELVIVEADNRGDKGEIANVTQKFITRTKYLLLLGTRLQAVQS